MGWSDECEVLCRCAALLFESIHKTKVSWEDFLPVKYRATAKYSIVTEQTQAEVRALSQMLDAAAIEWNNGK